MTSSVRTFEGTIRVKGFRIAYVLWTPVDTLSFNETSSYDAMNIGIDPLSITNHFEETMICFHGWLDNANSFAPLAPKLCNKFNMRVIGIDMPGHGKSSHSSLGYYSHHIYIATVIRILHRIHSRSFHIMAHSMSATFLPYLIPILEKSERFIIKSFICIEQFGALFRSQSRKSRINIDELLPSQPEQIELELEDEMEAQNVIHTKTPFVKRELPKLYNSIDELVKTRLFVTTRNGKHTIGEKSARLILERNVGKLIVVEEGKKQIKYYLRFDPKLKGGSRISLIYDYDVEQMVKNGIAKIKCPSLGVFGESGFPYFWMWGSEYIKKYCGSNIQIIKMTGGHHLHADNPDAFLKQITPFLTNAIAKYKKKYPNSNGVNGNSKL